MANPAPTINQINAFNATQGTTIDFNIIGGTELIRSNRIYIYDLSDNSLICTHLYVSTESIHELPPNTDGSIVYESGKSSADFVNGAQYYAQIQTYTDTNGTQGGSGLSVAKMFWCLSDPTLTITTIPSTISTTSYNVSATYTDTSASVVSNIIQQYQFNLYSATGSLLQSSGVVVGSGTQQGTSAVYDISHNFTGLNVGSSYYVTVDVTTTQGMSVTTQSNTFTVSIDTPTLGEATVVNNACDGYISVTSNLSGEYGDSGSGEIVSFETDSENIFSKLQVDLEPTQEGTGDPSPSNVRPIRGHGGVTIENTGVNIWDEEWELGYFNTNTGQPVASTIISRSKNFIPCLPSTSYYYKSNGANHTILYYDEAQEFISLVTAGGGDSLITTPSNCQYMKIAFLGTTYNNDISINYPSTDHDYHEYQAQTITQDFNVSLTPTSTDTTPYLFKAVGDAYGDRLEDKIVGGTVAWNQQLKLDTVTNSRGITASLNSDRSITINGTATSDAYVTIDSRYSFKLNESHKYLYKGCPSGGSRTGYFLGDGWSNMGRDYGKGTIFTATSGTFQPSIIVIKGNTVSNLTFKPSLFDLTQMFGSTIADYIYSLEQSQAGAGVAWFKKLFPKDYYEYNAGELLSVEGLQSHDTVGFNQWDEEWVTVQKSGETRVANKTPIPVLSGATYYVKAPQDLYIDAVDSSGGYISYIVGGKNKTITIPQGVDYISFTVNGSYGTTYKNDICINLSNPTRNGEYEPYEKHSYPLDSSLTLRGIPKLDASNNLYYDGDEYTSDGKVRRNTILRAYQSGDESLANAITDGTNTVVYSANASTQTATPYTNPQIVSKYGTLEYVTNSIVPVGHKTTYLTRDIFGGYVDLISGKLVVDRKTILLDGTQSFGDSAPAQNPNGGYNAWFKYDDIGMGDAKRSNPVDNPKLSNRFVYTPRKATAQNDIPIGSFSGNVLSSGNVDDWIVFAFDSSMNTYEKISQWFKDNNTQICYELATPQTYQLTPQQVNTLVGTNNVWSEQGNIELSYHIPITNLLVKRQDVDDVSGGWLTLYSQPISQASDMDFTFIDFLNQYGKTYKYALVPLLTQTQSGVEVEVEGGYTVSDEVQSVFDGVFIADSTGSQKCKANVGYGNVDMNQVVGSITPIGAKYPIIITNSQNQYHNGSISGTIVPDDYYFNGNLSRIDMVKKRNELEQFLTNKRVKVIKDWNGNIWLVMIVGNVSCTFNNNYGMGIVNFSTNWTEVGDPTNQQDLQATGLINVGGV